MCLKCLDFLTVVYMDKTVRKGAIDEARKIHVVSQKRQGTDISELNSLFINLCVKYFLMSIIVN